VDGVFGTHKARGEVDGAVGGDEDVVFDPDADSA
jgi:hypothetical protein